MLINFKIFSPVLSSILPRHNMSLGQMSLYILSHYLSHIAQSKYLLDGKFMSSSLHDTFLRT